MGEKRSEILNANPLPKRGMRVQTPDGLGTVTRFEMRKNTNRGPGTREVVVQLDDGRVHRFTPSKCHPLA